MPTTDLDNGCFGAKADFEPRLLPLKLVVAAALVDTDNRVLIGKRPDGKDMAGLWEFPGGKQEPGEAIKATVVRELREELAIEVELTEFLISLDHAYSHKRLRFEVFL